MRIAEKRAANRAAHAARDENSKTQEEADVTIHDAIASLDDEAPRHEDRP
jgi:hypothetical protein